MRLRTWVPALAGLAFVSAFSARASAQAVATGYSVDRFEPSERGSDWFANDSLDLRGKFRPALGVVGAYSYRTIAVYGADGNLQRSPVRNLLFAHVGGSLVLVDRLRLSVSMPFELFADGHTKAADGRTFVSPPNEQGLGDLRFAVDARLLGTYGDAFTLALGAQLWVPTGSQEQWAGDGEVRVRPRVMAAGDIGIFAYSAQLNIAYRSRSEAFGASTLGSDVGFAAAVGARLADKKLLVGPEIYGSTVLDDAFARRATPIEGILGAHYLVGDVKVGAGVGAGLTRGFGSPEARALLGIEWAPGVAGDKDGDGIADDKDACPTVPGVATNDPKTNGCPGDRDGDGIGDDRDACPDVKGVATTDPATNGCPPPPPPPDSDGDGILDKDDACPNEKGVHTNDPKTNGCPADSDGDGILDKDDACPNEKGLRTNDPKTNGCPDPDRDKDGILNAADACPDEPGPSDPDPKRSGCPKAFIQLGQIKILDQVKFKTGSAEILPGKESEDVLQAVKKVLTEHPEVKKVSVEGHTDSRGAAALNRKLSADRAASVVKWLAGHGIDKARLTSAGFGPDRPIDTNETDDGRKNNRRVEFRIAEPAEGSQVTK